MIYKIALKNRGEISESTMAFYFEKPKDFEFIAGQHIVMTHINPPETDAEGDRRVFCMASAPYEEDLIFAMRMRESAFKRALKTMPAGSEVEIDGPHGSFVLHDDTLRPAVFLAGGIGITPFRSMLLESTNNNSLHKFLLFYSNFRPDDAAFLRELSDLGKKNLNYTFIPTMTEMERSSKAWEGETRYIDKAMLEKYIDTQASPVYYIAGPPGFVLAMKGLLQEAGIEPDDIKTDQFSGY